MKPSNNKIIFSCISTGALMLAATSAMAGLAPPVNNIPEPGTLSLLGLGAVVLVAAAIHKRRNKK